MTLYTRLTICEKHNIFQTRAESYSDEQRLPLELRAEVQQWLSSVTPQYIIDINNGYPKMIWFKNANEAAMFKLTWM